MTRAYNFSAGPAVIPEEVLLQAAGEMLDWRGCGMSVMEMSHRSREFMSIIDTARADVRDLLEVPQEYKILFLQGGGLGENAIVPMNLLGRSSHDPQAETIDFIQTGAWSVKSTNEAKRYAQTHVAATGAGSKFTGIPAPEHWKLTADAAYVHVCTNETIDGVEFGFVPDIAAATNGAPLVADMSSHILSRVVDVARYGVIFAGAQKNVGPAGLTLVIVREDLLGRALPICPSAFNWKIVAEHDSMFNTPPTYAIYVAGLVFQWLKRQGGIVAMEQRNLLKAALLYDFLDATDFYENRVDPACRSRMNVPFYLVDETLNDAFLAGANERGLLQLRGHKSVGGMRASLYNAMPIAGVRELIDYMREFQRTRG